MREGPLAQLFRKTEDDASPDAKREDAQREEPRREESEAPRQPRTGRPLPEDTSPQATRRTPEPQAQEEIHGAPPAEPAASAKRQEESSFEQRATEAARRAEERARRREQEPERQRGLSRYEGVPSPEERLRSVFSPDIPENILDRDSGPAPVRRDPEPERSPYAMPSGTKVTEPVLRVVGVGGAGVNAVNRMIEAEVEGVEFLAVNTDTQSLEQSAANNRMHIGSDITRGLGSGSDPDLGRAAAMEDYDELKSLLKGSDMVFITAGAGGGTGTGAAPVVARISREVGALTVGIVTKPFSFEGARRGEQADQGVEDLAREVDTLIVIPNARLLTVLDKSTSMVDAFRVADDVLRQGVQGISDLITLPGLINLDFADVRTIMSEAGQALLGIGMGTGEHRAMDAVEHAIESPLLETSLEGARSILLSVTGGRDLSLWEVNEAAKAVAEAAHPDANIIFGAMVDEKVDDQVWVTVVATGYGDRPQHRAAPRGEGRESRIPADAEPRVRRGRQAEVLDDIDVPEFIPR
jgi:cell division protein FtsZ